MSNFKVTTKWMLEQYNNYRKCFSSLPNDENVSFGLINSVRKVGYCRTMCFYNYKTCKYDKMVGTIFISTKFELTEEEAINVLVHEMIHLYLAHIGYPKAHHGYLFINEMDEINSKYNLNITIKANNVKIITDKKIVSIILANDRNNNIVGLKYGKNISISDIIKDISQYKGLSNIKMIHCNNYDMIEKLPLHRIGSRYIRYRILTGEINKLQDNIVTCEDLVNIESKL